MSLLLNIPLPLLKVKRGGSNKTYIFGCIMDFYLINCSLCYFQNSKKPSTCSIIAVMAKSMSARWVNVCVPWVKTPLNRMSRNAHINWNRMNEFPLKYSYPFTRPFQRPVQATQPMPSFRQRCQWFHILGWETDRWRSRTAVGQSRRFPRQC